LISTSPGETRTALLSGGRLTEIWIDRVGGSSLVGNIYLGRVGTVSPGLNAAFVSFGQAQDGFLSLPEARPVGKTGGKIGDFAREGDAVVVQVQRDPVEDKGAKLTTHINLAGAFLIFRPHQAGITVSRRITEASERERLTALVADVPPDTGGFIVRTQAAEAKEVDIRKEAAYLTARWREIDAQVQSSSAPAQVYAEVDPACRAVRDFGGALKDGVVIDDTETLNRVRGYCDAHVPWVLPGVSHHKGNQDLFEAFEVAEQIDAAFQSRVTLPGGGSLIIHQTAALTAIDVNTGEQKAYEANLEAATEAARQIRLRNISGLIVIDFVPLRDDGQKKDILAALRTAAAGDPLGLNVAGYTRLGLVEMTRPRHGLSLRDVLGGVGFGEMRKSFETQALDLLRRVGAQARGGAGVTIKAPAGVIAALKGAGVAGTTAALALKQVQDRLGLVIGLDTEHTLADGQFDIIVGGGNGAKR
ncbi:MAG: Rne/Rng family ribonuclease, partial [Alphaproteobacteria bacterium]|nr:Rne/Rng family ribonuclease [Alphaproteobacteria bacterium]